MPRVTIAYDPDLSRIGRSVDVDDDEARRLIREGRVVDPDQSDDTNAAGTKTTTTAKAKTSAGKTT